MAQTALLPPVTAIRLVWARTGGFSNDEDSRRAALLAEQALQQVKDRVAQSQDVSERRYVEGALAAVDATLRSLEILHKGRELNFRENEQLRSAYLDDVRERLNFGNRAEDFVKSLPTMTITSAGGLTLAQYVGQFGVSDFTPWLAGLAAAAFGYLLNLWIVRSNRGRTQMLYVTQDYERGLYYDQYVSRAATRLTSLYLDLNRVHANVFGQGYTVEADASEIVRDLLQEVRPTFCKYIHKHMRERKITPELWALCETGREEAVKGCPLWEG